MAELTVKEGMETVNLPPIVAPTIVKTSEVEQKAEQIRKQRELPKKPGPNVSFKEMTDWLKLLQTEEMLSRIVIYVYRLDPPIIRQKVDPDADNNIDIFIDGFHELAEERIIDAHGGGTYRFIVRDDDAHKKSSDGYFQAKLTVPISIHPPKLDLREVDWDNKNCKGFRAWARAKRLIDDNNMPVIESKSNPSQNGTSTTINTDTTAMFKLMMEFVTKMNSDQQAQLKKQLASENDLGKGVGELLLEKMKQDDPNKQITTLATLMSTIKSAEPKQQQDNTITVIMPMFLQMMTQQAESSKQQFTMMLELMKDKKSDSEPVNEIDRLKALLEVAKEIKGGGSSTKSTAEVVSDIVANNLTPVLNIVGTIMAARMGAQVQSQPNGPIPVANSRPVTNNVEEINRRNAEMGQQTNQPPNTAPAVTQSEATAIIQQFGPLIYRKLGGDGWEFGAECANMFGDDIAASIVKHGVDGLLEAAKLVPTFWNQVVGTYGEPHFRKWLASFVNFREELARVEAEENEEEDNGK